jgi:hypothetical protein
MSGISGVAPSGSVLALRLTDNGGNRDRLQVGTGSDASGTIRMTVTETISSSTTAAYPINRWTEVLSSTSNIQLTNGRGTETDSNASFQWQVIEFTGSGPVAGNGANKKVDTHIGNNYNDPTTGLLVNIDCVECHNPMTTQTNLSFIRDTLRGNAVVFTNRNLMADGAMPYNGVCEVCHTQTLHYRNDNSSPSMPHNPGTICTSCHLHLGNGFDKDAVPAAPHNTGTFLTDCFLCHVTAMPYSTPIPQAKCEQCHDAAGLLRSENGGSGEFDAAPIVQTHSSTVNPPRPYGYNNTCLDCHDPMNGSANDKLVRVDLSAAGGGSNVVYPPYIIAGSPYNGVCETCHTQTVNHRNNASGDHTHNNASVCTDCHPHGEGFQLDISVPFPHDTQACNTCHTAEPDYAAAITNTACMSCHDGTPAVLVDRHYGSTYNDPTTSQPMDLECVECHNPMDPQTNLVFIRDTLRGNTVVFTAYTGTNSFADGDTTYDGVCEVCHTQTSHHRNDGNGPQQSHNDGQDCTTSCHPHPDGFNPTGGCTICHNSPQAGDRRQVVGAGGDIGNASGKAFHHVNGTVDDATCVVCHDQSNHQGNTDPGVLLNDPDGGAPIPYTGSADELTPLCVNCHDGDNETPFSDSGDNTNMNTANLIIEPGWTSTYNHSSNAGCIDCHGDSGGDGSTTAPYMNAHGGDNTLFLQGTGADDRARIYDTCVVGSCHGSGGTVNMITELSGTGGKHPIDGSVTAQSSIITGGADVFATGWSQNSVAVCSDCHSSSGGGPKGPHGSSYEFILRGADTSVTHSGGTPTNSQATTTYTQENLCINCHNASVYGLGTFELGGVPSNSSRGAIDHYDDGNPFRSQCGNADGDGGNNGSLQQIGCTNCHAGAGRNYGAHSSSYGNPNNPSKWTTQGAGFMNGNAWSQAPDNNGCYSTSSGGWSTCNRNQHD